VWIVPKSPGEWSAGVNLYPLLKIGARWLPKRGKTTPRCDLILVQTAQPRHLLKLQYREKVVQEVYTSYGKGKPIVEKRTANFRFE
jgi:hypothetical protein